ncbi:GGDEF domain-containing protein [Pseudoblastomonas halimionae]|uniref:diguanylate cyclase n=1 Tax=Alteriqipengyuania halimionae TaxID=1926630 RepID=A0A6I4U8Z7_9SPHN|nr:GGDEF domain-containing protein [Alteriqipengyuania halimionae]MXP10972.1 diguanylate cyclase [Alteriqipengyuania halimionae]
MDAVVVRLTLSLIGPGIMIVFGLAFVGAWLVDRRRPYLLLLALTCALFAVGAISQIVYWPNSTGLNALVSGAFYTCAVLLGAQAILLRSRRPFPWIWFPVVLAGFLILTAYYFYIERNLLARVYIQNFGYGLVLLAAALRLKTARLERTADRILFWTLLVFALHFFPRTLLTIGFTAPVGEKAFANSAFWQTLQLSLSILGVSLALAIFNAAFSDLLEDMRTERNTDALTGTLNRRGFEEAATGLLKRSGGQGALVLLDLDHFKRINDAYGHHVGDHVLRDVGQLIRRNTHTQDILGRFGGEEFMILIADGDVDAARSCAERLALALANHRFGGIADNKTITASFGVTALSPGEAWETVFNRADKCLYAAKTAGRNRIATETGTELPRSTESLFEPGRARRTRELS